MTAPGDDPFTVLDGLWLGFSTPAAKCEYCGRRRKLFGRRRGERLCRSCHPLVIDAYTGMFLSKYLTPPPS
jgi:hypothetical protein